MEWKGLDIYMAEPTKFADLLDMICQNKRGISINSKSFGLSNWKNGVIIC